MLERDAAQFGRALQDGTGEKNLAGLIAGRASVRSHLRDRRLPSVAPPATPNPASVNLYDNIERLKFAVDQILPLHGRKVPFAELQKAIGKSS